MLAEARPYLQDAVFLAKVDARIVQLKDYLRTTQRVDGGWGRTVGQQSDPLITAIVGTALDYTHPEPTDPVLRKTVQYLLSKQSSDGSWTGQYFSTRLGATSYVMAYLPKAVARLGGIPVFRGTGVPVKSLFDHLHAGDSLDSFLMDFPAVSRTQAQMVVDLAGHYLLRAIFEQ